MMGVGAEFEHNLGKQQRVKLRQRTRVRARDIEDRYDSFQICKEYEDDELRE